jgi:hypothetical protein
MYCTKCVKGNTWADPARQYEQSLQVALAANLASGRCQARYSPSTPSGKACSSCMLAGRSHAKSLLHACSPNTPSPLSHALVCAQDRANHTSSSPDVARPCPIRAESSLQNELIRGSGRLTSTRCGMVPNTTLKRSPWGNSVGSRGSRLRPLELQLVKYTYSSSAIAADILRICSSSTYHDTSIIGSVEVFFEVFFSTCALDETFLCYAV